MLDEQAQSTSVGGDSPSAIVSESTDTAAPLVSDSGEANQTETAGDVITQSEPTGTEEAGTVDPTQEADPLEGIPSLEELEQNKSQQYAQALINLRTAYEARKEEINGLKPLEQFKDITTLGEPETIKQVVETHKLLFTPVVNPTTQQVERDEYGFEKTTTTPFIEKMDGDNPGIAEQMLNDLLRYTPDRDGQKIPLWQSMLRDGFGLDPARLDDYKNIDALTAQPTGEITSEELDQIPSDLQEAFKSLPPGVRQDLLAQDEETRKFNLEAHKERFDNRTAAQQRQQQEAQAQQAQQAQLLEQVRSEQESFVSQQLQQGYATIMDDLASKVTFSGDEAQNEGIKCQIGALLFSLRDPDFRQANSSRLEKMGISLDSTFDEALSAADKHLRDAKAFELFGQKGRAQDSKAKAVAAKNQVLTKLSLIALKAAKMAGGTLQAKANGQGQLLQNAMNVRATPPNGGSVSESGGYLPAGMRANSPEADVYLARQTGLLR